MLAALRAGRAALARREPGPDMLGVPFSSAPDRCDWPSVDQPLPATPVCYPRLRPLFSHPCFRPLFSIPAFISLPCFRPLLLTPASTRPSTPERSESNGLRSLRSALMRVESGWVDRVRLFRPRLRPRPGPCPRPPHRLLAPPLLSASLPLSASHRILNILYYIILYIYIYT